MRISDGVQTCALPIFERGRVELLQRRRRVGLLQAQSLEFALKQFAPVLDVARAIELVEPRAHLLARTRAGEESVGRHQPVARSEERRVGKECVSTCRSRWSPYL